MNHPELIQALQQAHYLHTECRLPLADACTDSAQFYGMSALELWAVARSLKPVELQRVAQPFPIFIQPMAKARGYTLQTLQGLARFITIEGDGAAVVRTDWVGPSAALEIIFT